MSKSHFLVVVVLLMLMAIDPTKSVASGNKNHVGFPDSYGSMYGMYYVVYLPYMNDKNMLYGKCRYR